MTHALRCLVGRAGELGCHCTLGRVQEWAAGTVRRHFARRVRAAALSTWSVSDKGEPQNGAKLTIKMFEIIIDTGIFVLFVLQFKRVPK